MCLPCIGIKNLKNESERKEYLQTPDQGLLCICKQENEEEDAKVDWKL